MFSFEHYELSDVNSSAEILSKLFGIFKTTLNPDLTEEEFQQYLFASHPDQLEITFIYKNDDVAGFCTSVAYPRRCNQKKVVILRSAFGLQDKYKKGNFPLQGLFYKYIRYKLKHLFTPVYVAGFMANPLMYAMICKYTLRSYPRRNKPVPEKILQLKEDILGSMQLSDEQTPFVLKIHFQVRFHNSDTERFRHSTDKDVNYFLSVNPGYNQQMGVLVIVPVTVVNMTYTFLRFVIRKLPKPLFKIHFKKYKISMSR